MKKNDANIFYSDKKYIDYCRKICGNNDLHKDLFQETVIILSSWESRKIDSIDSLFRAVAWRQWNLKESKFYAKYRRNRYDAELIDNIKAEENNEINNVYRNYILNLIDEKPKNDVDLFVKTVVGMRINGMTLRAISHELNIPVGTIRNTVNKFINDVRSNIDFSGFSPCK